MPRLLLILAMLAAAGGDAAAQPTPPPPPPSPPPSPPEVKIAELIARYRETFDANATSVAVVKLDRTTGWKCKPVEGVEVHDVIHVASGLQSKLKWGSATLGFDHIADHVTTAFPAWPEGKLHRCGDLSIRLVPQITFASYQLGVATFTDGVIQGKRKHPMTFVSTPPAAQFEIRPNWELKPIIATSRKKVSDLDPGLHHIKVSKPGFKTCFGEFNSWQYPSIRSVPAVLVPVNAAGDSKCEPSEDEP